MKQGFVIRVEGKYISAILANGHPEKPVVYLTPRLNEAKAWKTPQGVRKARAQAGRGGTILLFKKDSENGPRVLIGMMAKTGL